MNKTSRIIASAVATATLAIGTFAQEGPDPRLEPNPEAKLHRFSTTVEKERPKLNKETQDLIAAYRRDPSEANREALRRQVAANYDAVVARKKAKLEELKQTAKHQSKIDEMQVIVDEMLRDREARIDASMARFTDKRFRPGVRDDAKDGYLPVLGTTGQNVCCAQFPVTAADWAKFSGAEVQAGKANHPATGISFADAERYCAWLSEKDPAHTYRLPTEEEWELAAGHMPKDADFNCGVSDATTPVDAYAKTMGACGGSDFWGNCWEWTSTARPDGGRAVKGGAFDSPRTACRTEARTESRDPAKGHPNVTFRVFREDRASQPVAPAEDVTGFLPFGNDNICIARFPVTNSDYAKFVKETGHQPPRYWKDGAFPAGKDKHPVLWVSLRDAEAYCKWLGEKDATHSYRLPTAAEWDAAAGPTPRDAEFNFNGVVASHLLKADPDRLVEYVHPKSVRKGEKTKLSDVISISQNGGVKGWVDHANYTGFIYTDLFKEISDAGGWTTPVDSYPQTKAASGALDMWGNCWEWTATEITASNGAERGQKVNAIKGGSWYANRRSCLTDFEGEGRRPDGHYNTVGFRVVQISKAP